MCCSMLQCVAVCCRELRRDAVYMHEMPVLTNTGPSMNVLQRVAACCELQHVAVYVHEIPLLTNTGTGMSVLQHVAECCRVLQRVTACCSVCA